MSTNRSNTKDEGKQKINETTSWTNAGKAEELLKKYNL